MMGDRRYIAIAMTAYTSVLGVAIDECVFCGFAHHCHFSLILAWCCILSAVKASLVRLS